MKESTGFLAHYEQKVPKSAGIRISSQGLFVEHAQLENLYEEYRTWIQRESNSGKLLEKTQAAEKLHTINLHKEYYLIEGKTLWVGKLVNLENLGNSSKIQRYEATLTDAASLIHPKDPLLTTGNIKFQNGTSGPEFAINVNNKNLIFSQNLLKEFFELIKKLPRIRRRYPLATQSLRGAVTTLAQLASKARPIDKKNILFIPGRLRTLSIERFSSNNGIYFIFSKDKQTLETCFSPIGSALHNLLRSEIDELRKTAKRGRIGILEFSKKIPQIVGFINTQQDRFTLPYRVVDEFFKLRGFKTLQDSKDKIYYTCFDLLLQLSRAFEKSGWILPKDLHKKERFHIREELLYRASKDFLFYINKQRQIISVLRRGKKDNTGTQLVLKTLAERKAELAAAASN